MKYDLAFEFESLSFVIYAVILETFSVRVVKVVK